MQKTATAMSELIEWMEIHNMDCTSEAMRKAKQLLEKEKEYLVAAYEQGCTVSNQNNIYYPDGIEYFNNTYTQK